MLTLLRYSFRAKLKATVLVKRDRDLGLWRVRMVLLWDGRLGRFWRVKTSYTPGFKTRYA